MLNFFNRKKLSSYSRDGISFIEFLFNNGYISYPIDYEVYKPTEKELKETLGYWFGHTKWQEKGDKFIQFGMDGTGSMFCFWLYPTLESEPPIVLFGSEGERSLVATNINDFIKQLNSGKLFYDGNWLEPEEDEESELDWEALKHQAVKYLGPWDENSEELSTKASMEHPDFNAWVEKCSDY